MAEEFSARNLAGTRFRRVDLSSAEFEHVDMSGARFNDVDLTGVRIRGALLRDVKIGGELESLTVNGIDVAPLIEAELDRRHPERAKLRPTDAAGFREAWALIEQLWAGTIAKASELDPALLHERVDGEWSFIETLRHLAFATDAWIRRAILGEPSPWDPFDLPWDEMPDIPGIPRDRDVRPALEDVPPCAPTGWRPCARSSASSPTNSSLERQRRCPGRDGHRSRRRIPLTRSWASSSTTSGGTASLPSAISTG